MPRKEGIPFTSGPGIRSGKVEGNIRDVMPTVMGLLDLPVAADRRGRALGIRQGKEGFA